MIDRRDPLGTGIGGQLAIGPRATKVPRG